VTASPRNFSLRRIAAEDDAPAVKMEPRGAGTFYGTSGCFQTTIHGGNFQMKTKFLTAALAATAIIGLSGAALAQTTGPAAQDTTKMNKDMSKDGMKANNSNMAPTTQGANTGPSQKPMTTPAEPKGKESNGEAPKR
jgi:hypothetical protein